LCKSGGGGWEGVLAYDYFIDTFYQSFDIWI
jgi:hypothetical protein